jgi:phenylacetate-CoA ligase
MLPAAGGRVSVSSALPPGPKSAIGGIEWPPLYGPRVAPLAAAIQTFDRTQWLGADALRDGQRRQVAALARHFARHSAPFRERLARSGLRAETLAWPHALETLAPLTRRDLQAEGLAVATLPPGHRPVSKYTTSGSTGEPVVVFRTSVSQLHWLALTMRFHLWAEPDFSGRICAVRANLPRVGEEPSWGAPVSLFHSTGPALKIDIAEDIDRQIEQIRAFGATSLIVYPSNLAAILDAMGPAGLPALRRVRTIGETLAPALRERVAAELGASITDCYSSQEIGYVALECPDGGLYHLMSETVLVEVVDEEGRPCAEGEPGRVLVTDLHNFATPLVRYEIGDWAVPGPPCACGRGLPTLRRILGRERNLIHKPDGTRHWPLTGFKRFREIAPVIQYQLRQTELERIELRLVTERPLTEAEEEALRSWLQEILDHPFAVDFAYFESRLPLGANGKFEEFMSLL